VELIPKAIVIGAFAPPAPPGQTQINPERVNRIWSDIAPRYGFTQLQMAPDGANANFIGRTLDDGVTIQLPLLQVRTQIATTTEVAGESIQSMFASILRHLQIQQLFNVGIKLVYNAPMQDNDARNFVLRRLLRVDDDRLEDLAAGAQGLWGGVKYVVPQQDRQYTLTIEPLQSDEMRSLFIDLDAQFPGEASANSIAGRVGEVQTYLSGPVDRYLDGLLELQ
jgi:hypothetical protein